MSSKQSEKAREPMTTKAWLQLGAGVCLLRHRWLGDPKPGGASHLYPGAGSYMAMVNCLSLFSVAATKFLRSSNS